MSVNIIRQQGGIQIIRDARGPMGPQNFMFGAWLPGAANADELLLRAEITQASTPSSALSAASAEANTAAIDQVYEMTMNGDLVGTVTWPAGETQAEIEFTESSWPVGVFKLTAPSVTDPGLSGISVTIGGAKT